jgi:hypothetical protein
MVGVIAAGAGALLYAGGVVSAAIITGSDQYHDTRSATQFTGVEEVVSVLLLLATPGAFLAALGLTIVSRSPVRRALAWIVAGLLLGAVPFGWLPYWSDKQGVLFPVVFAAGVAGVLGGLISLARARRS